MTKIGYLGLGVMGYGMTDNLMKKGKISVWGYDPVEVARERFAANGGKVVEGTWEIYETCDIIFQCLPTDEIVEKTIREISAAAKPGTIIVDMGATSPNLIRTLNPVVEEHGLYLLDAPVSGGETGALSGTLAIMVGGRKDVFDRIEPWLQMMGKTVTYMGLSGCGSIAKVANNMMVGAHLCSMTEAYAFAVKAGLDPGMLFQAIRGGFAQSAVMDLKIPKILERDFSASARIAVHLKDMNHAVELAEHLGVEIPLSATVKKQMEWMLDQGLINEDQCALVKYYEDTMGVLVQHNQKGEST